MLGTIDEKHGVFHVVFLLVFTQEDLRRRGRRGRKHPDVKEPIRFGTDGSVQPAALPSHSDHGLVHRDGIRTRVAGRL